MIFYLGTAEPGWLRRTDVPLFVSHNRLRKRKTLPQAMGPWALDSGGFTQLSMHGKWTITPHVYASAVRHYRDEIGSLAWAAPQDWMCEPFICQKTGMDVAAHQQRTVANYLELRAIAPDLPFIPVLQGWRFEDYLACVELYDQAGVDLRAAPVVGLGSVCRRQATREALHIIGALASLGLRLHGFGIKTRGLYQASALLASADSMAWSYQDRTNALHGLAERVPWRHQLPYALAWRECMLARVHAGWRSRRIARTIPHPIGPPQPPRPRRLSDAQNSDEMWGVCGE